MVPGPDACSRLAWPGLIPTAFTDADPESYTPDRRAPPDIRGSGKERGHGTELTHCPKCGKGLKPGKHHVGCSGGKAGPRQTKRSRLVRHRPRAPFIQRLPDTMRGGGGCPAASDSSMDPSSSKNGPAEPGMDP